MKRLLIAIGWFCLVACQSTGSNIRSFIPGTYAKFSEGEFSKAWDTIRISLYDAHSNTYVVLRHTGFQRIVEGKIQPKEYKKEQLRAVFDPSNGQMQDLKSGKLFVFSPDKGTVLMGSAEYRKVD